MNKFLAVVAAGATIGGLGSVGSASVAVGAAPPPITWRSCQDVTLQEVGAQCGFVKVPLDYAHPNGRTIRVAVSRVAHTSSNYQGVILVNPGGPGASGLDLATLGQYVPRHVGDEYDWIGFDPRGVGASTPRLSCQPNFLGYDRPDYTPSTTHLANAWLHRSRSYAQACGRKHGALLRHMRTPDLARDMDQIRKALGVGKISYYGFSYGTYLGQVYSTMFPRHVKRMVLDSNVDPRQSSYRAGFQQDIAFERNINIWFTWVAKYHRDYHLGATRSAVRSLWFRQKAALTKHAAGGKIGPDEWTDIFLTAAYYRQAWADLGDLFAGWVHHHRWRPLKAEYDVDNTPGDDSEYAAFNAVTCTDTKWPRSWPKWQRDNNRVAAKAPFETWGSAWFTGPCLYWPVKGVTPTKVNGHKVASALLIDETLDAATPYPGSLEVRRLYPHSSLIAEPGGTSHADSLYGDACVDNLIADYLATGKRPPRQHWDGPDALCRPLPDPVPSAMSSSARSNVQEPQRPVRPRRRA